MSSKRIRDILIPEMTTFFSPTILVDITGRYEDLNSYLNSVEGIDPKDPWVGIDFVGDPEIPITVPANNGLGKFRETGVMLLHIVEPTSRDTTHVDNILSRSELTQNFLRGKNISGILIETVSPPNFEAGTTLKFSGGWTAATILTSFESDLNL